MHCCAHFIYLAMKSITGSQGFPKNFCRSGWRRLGPDTQQCRSHYVAPGFPRTAYAGFSKHDWNPLLNAMQVPRMAHIRDLICLMQSMPIYCKISQFFFFGFILFMFENCGLIWCTFRSHGHCRCWLNHHTCESLNIGQRKVQCGAPRLVDLFLNSTEYRVAITTDPSSHRYKPVKSPTLFMNS